MRKNMAFRQNILLICAEMVFDGDTTCRIFLRGKPMLDEIDRKIVTLLSRDGRASAAEISNQIGEVSERTIRNRISSLLASGRVVIGAMIYPTIDETSVQADVTIDVAPGQIDVVARQIAQLRSVMYLASTTGRHALVASVIRPTLTDLHDYVERKIGKIEGVVAVEPNLVTRVYKFFNYDSQAQASTHVPTIGELPSQQVGK